MAENYPTLSKILSDQHKEKLVTDNQKGYTINIWNNPPYRIPPFKSVWDKSTEMVEEMAEKALEKAMCSYPGRTRLGQSSEALLSSGLSAAVLRIPEEGCGSFVCVSL